MRFDRLFYAGIIVGVIVVGAATALVWEGDGTMTSDGIEGARPIGTWIDETHAFVRGEKSREDAVEEALRRLEEGPTMPSFSPSEHALEDTL